ncbi:hypothetical protein [Nonomuraea sp. NPDC005692]|uniref:hypothetical protein n=1 Tax=Nonomuraea sp. NPDC005692 TaxID=3157168 RepID=UPI0033EAA916
MQRLVFGDELGEPGLRDDALGVDDRHDLGHHLMCGVGLVEQRVHLGLSGPAPV